MSEWVSLVADQFETPLLQLIFELFLCKEMDVVGEQGVSELDGFASQCPSHQIA
jgi:hypothetical protein